MERTTAIIPEDYRPHLDAHGFTGKYSFRTKAYWDLCDKEGNRVHTLGRIFKRESQVTYLYLF